MKKETSLKSRSGKLHWTLIVGLIIFMLGVGPLLVGGLLDELGIIDIGNGLGLGLLFTVSIGPSIILIIIGVIITVVKRNKRNDKPKTISEKGWDYGSHYK